MYINQQKERYDASRKWRKGVTREELSKRDDPEYTERVGESKQETTLEWQSVE
jgi:hypothetical protein